MSDENTRELVGAKLAELLPFVDIARDAVNEASATEDRHAQRCWSNQDEYGRQFLTRVVREACHQLATLRVMADHGNFCEEVTLSLHLAIRIQSDEDTPF